MFGMDGLSQSLKCLIPFGPVDFVGLVHILWVNGNPSQSARDPSWRGGQSG